MHFGREGREYVAWTALDREAIAAAVMRYARQPRMSQQLDQLPQVSNILPSDLFVLWRNGTTYAVAGSALPGAGGTIVLGNFVYNVKGAPYNAIGNGTHDDTAAIQAAAAACAATGGVLYFPLGTYLISTSILLGSNTTVRGDGIGTSVIQASNTFAGVPGKYSTPTPSNIVFMNSQRPNAPNSIVQKNIYFEGLTINGNGGVVGKYANNPGGHISLWGVYGCGVENCELINGASNGIEIIGQDNDDNWPATSLEVNWYAINNRINLNYNNGNTPSTTGTFPIIARGASVGLVLGNRSGELNATHTNDSCDVPGCVYMVIASNAFYNGGDGIGLNAADSAVVCGNMVIGNGGYGISSFSSGGPDTTKVGCNHVSITSNLIVDSGVNPGTHPGKTAIRLSSPRYPAANPVDFVISSNHIQFSTSGTGPYGIHVECSQGTIVGNTIDLGQCADMSAGISLDAGAGGGGMSGTGPGIYDITVAGNRILNGKIGSGVIGIQFQTNGTSTGVITRADVYGNSVLSVDVPVSSTSNIEVMCSIHDNPGINPRGNLSNLPTVPPGGTTSPLLFNNTYAYNLFIVIKTGSGGTVTNVKLNGAGLGLSCGNSGSVWFMFPAGYQLSSGLAVPNEIELDFTGTFGTDVTMNTYGY